jgi:FkbM family methyltransferase
MKNRIREFIYNRYNISFSKSGDDVQLMKLINNRTPGAYVDIGCWHPVKASNTYFFYVRGWKGICIDPNPELKVLYDQLRPKDNFVNAGVGESGSSLEYYMFEESSMNTFSYDFVKKHNAESKIIKKLEIPLYSLKEILDANLDKNDRLDFFDIDVEGFDIEVLKTNDWNVYRPKVIVIESDIALQNDITSEIVKYLEQQNYRLIGKSIINGDLGNLFLISK